MAPSFFLLFRCTCRALEVWVGTACFRIGQLPAGFLRVY